MYLTYLPTQPPTHLSSRPAVSLLKAFGGDDTLWQLGPLGGGLSGSHSRMHDAKLPLADEETRK